MNPLLLALLAQYSFNSSEDRFYRLKSGKNARIGVAAGGIVKTGYRMVRVGDRQYLEHRLVWLLFNGEMPTSGTEIDHINGIRTDNRIENLRLATRAQNNGNRKKTDANTSGYKGVSWHSGARKWRATIQTGGRQVHLGFFADAASAHLAYIAAAKAIFGEFARAA